MKIGKVNDKIKKHHKAYYHDCMTLLEGNIFQ